MQELFTSVATHGRTDANLLRSRITASGISPDDFRLRSTMERLSLTGDKPIDFEEFTGLVGEELRMVNRCLRRDLVIPGWEEFCSDIERIDEAVAPNKAGSDAECIPILRDADPEPWRCGHLSLHSISVQAIELCLFTGS